MLAGQADCCTTAGIDLCFAQLLDKRFGSQLCSGYSSLCYPYKPWKRRQKQTFQAPDLSSAQSPACSPGNALRCSSAVGLYLYPDNLLSIMKSLFWQGMHLSLNQNHSGNGTETRTSKLATVLRGALLAGCLGG